MHIVTRQTEYLVKFQNFEINSQENEYSIQMFCCFSKQIICIIFCFARCLKLVMKTWPFLSQLFRQQQFISTMQSPYLYVHTLACMMVLLDSLETVFLVVNVDDDNDNDDDDDVSRRNQSKSRHTPPPLDMPIFGRRIRARVHRSQTGHKNGKLSPPPTARHAASVNFSSHKSEMIFLSSPKKPSDWGVTHPPTRPAPPPTSRQSMLHLTITFYHS